MNTLIGEVLTLPKMSGSVSAPSQLSGNVGAKTINIGGKGDDGATFIPSVSDSGIISWTNDKDLPNPEPVNIKGKDGKDGKDGVNGKDGADGKDGYTPQKNIDYFDGKDGKNGENGDDGITPHIGNNGNWFVGETDTGKPSRGADGKDGKDGTQGEQGIQGEKGDKGDPGNDYILTDADKEEIAEMAADLVDVPDSGGNVDLTGYATEQFVRDGYQPKGNYLTEVPSGYATEEFVRNRIAEAELGGEEVDLSGYAQKSEIPTKVSQLQNDKGYLTQHQDISGKLDANKLPEAINTALAQAKARGEFDGKDGVDGKDGYTPVKGVDYFDGSPGKDGKDGNPGADGYTPVKGKDYFDGKDGQNGSPGKDGTSATHSWNGTVLTVTSASGTSSADLKGEPGEDGSDGKDGSPGSDGQRGTGLLPITTTPTAYTTAVGGITPEYRIALSTVKTQSGVTEVLVGDTLRHSYYHYPVKYVDASYAYCGTRVSIRGATGKAGADGATGATGVAGRDGVDGYTPVRGVDYYTETDKAEFSEYIATELAKRGQLNPEFANSIEECTDTTKLYVLPDGYIYAYMLTAETEPEPLFTNQLPIAINSDGTPYVGPNGEKGYKPGYRVSSSGSEKAQTFEGYACTGFIPAKPGDVIRVKNVDTMRSSSADDCAHCTVCHYDANFARIGTSMQYWREMPVSADGTVTMTLNLTGAVYIRTSLKSVTEDSILTVNEEIAYSSGGTGYAWANTGHAFVPADYEDRIVALENALSNPEPSVYNGNILYGKKWVACGDSFTYKGYATADGFDESVYKYQDGRFVGKNIVYPYIIGLRNNMNIVNIATGGQTMAASDNSFMTRYADIDADADYITLMFGINDMGLGKAVGTLEDSTNTTFCGAFNIAMEHILTNHPFAHIGIMVSTSTNAEFMKATRDMAERWGVPCLDFGSPQVPLMHGYTGRNVCDKAKEIREQNFRVSSSNMHPNTAAHEYESTFIEAWLRTL